MATFKAVVDHRKADGTYCIKIRITHNRKSLYVPTQLYVTDKHLTKSKEIKDHGYIIAANRIIDEMRGIVMNITGIEYMECERLRKVISDRMGEGKDFRLDFYDYAESKIAKMTMRTARSYVTAINHMMCIRKNLDINQLNTKTILEYKQYLVNSGMKPNTIALYLSKIKHLITVAKDEYNDDDVINVRVNPFKKGVIPAKSMTAHRVISVDNIRGLKTIKGDRWECFARDVFLLSFYLIGINLIDLFYLKKKDLQDGYLTYKRKKTKGVRQDEALIVVRIEKEAECLIEMYRDRSDSPYLLNFHLRYKDHEIMTKKVNDFLRRLRLYDKTLPAELTYYYARHSWATIAYNDCAIDMQTIHEALNHASDANMKITDVYVKKDFTRIWEANRKVLDYVFGSDNK